jgi:hypothetical protein
VGRDLGALDQGARCQLTATETPTLPPGVSSDLAEYIENRTNTIIMHVEVHLRELVEGAEEKDLAKLGLFAVSDVGSPTIEIISTSRAELVATITKGRVGDDFAARVRDMPSSKIPLLVAFNRPPRPIFKICWLLYLPFGLPDGGEA